MKKLIKVILILMVSLGAFLAVYNNSNLYKTPIGIVTDAYENEQNQTIHLKLVNGEDRGKSLMANNPIDTSLAYKEKYHKGNFLFLSVDKDGEHGQIIQQKRDYLMAFLIIVLVDIMLLVGKSQGIFTMLGLFINCSLYLLGISLYGKGFNVLALTCVLMIVFSFIILTLVNGLKKETIIAMIATLSTVGIIGLISALILWVAPNISYEFLDFMPEPYSLKEANLIFISEILVGALGAILDISVTVTAATGEIISQKPSIDRNLLIKSVRNISDDITGLMINVVFFTNIAMVFPIFVISMRNDIGFGTVLRNNGFFEISRFLTGAIGIVAAIPLSMFVATAILKGRKVK